MRAENLPHEGTYICREDGVTNSMQELIQSYPRVRPELPASIAEHYDQEYHDQLSRKRLAWSASKRVEEWMHRKVRDGSRGGSVLELGAGPLNHLVFEEPDGAYDIVEPRDFLYRDSPELSKVRDCYRDLTDVPTDRNYDRVISVAVLEHIPDLPQCLAKCGTLLKSGGILQAGIPEEGGFLWGAGWRMTTGLSFKLRTGCSYGLVMRHEHLSEAPEIEKLVGFFFEDVRVCRFPFALHHLSLYGYIEARQPRLERCREYALLGSEA